MKKLIAVAFALVQCIATLYGQNTYDPYNLPSLLPSFNYLYGGSGFSGEYQLYIRTDDTYEYYNHWSAVANIDLSAIDPLKPYSLSYRIEVVSFPFAPKHEAPADPFSRKLVSLTSTIYDALSDKWEGRIFRVKQGTYTSIGGAPMGAHSINEESTIVSAEYKSGYGTTWDRTIYPHSILKHIIYLHCDQGALSKPVDLLVFVLDHTRGRMRYYPASKFVTIESSGDSGVLQIFNSTGMQVKELAVKSGETLTLDISEFTRGMYIFVLSEVQGHISSEKLIFQ